MLKTWPSLAGPARLAVRLLGEAAVAALLGAALVLTWSDATPNHDMAGPVVPMVVHTAALPPGGDYADRLHIRIPAPPVEPPVPTAQPAMILIPSINVHRPVEPVGVDGSGMMYNTENLWNAGWYKGGPVPGAPGDAVIEGHAGYPDAPLLFGKLRRLHPGDKIVVVLADGSRHLFLVDSLTTWPAGSSPPGMGEPYGPPRLTLITCTGPFDDHYKTYADRLAVEATYAGLA